VVVVMMVMVVVVVVMHRLGRRGRRSAFLRDGVTGEAEGEHGCYDDGPDHGKVFLR
jgi:hypothetical protein